MEKTKTYPEIEISVCRSCGEKTETIRREIESEHRTKPVYRLSKGFCKECEEAIN